MMGFFYHEALRLGSVRRLCVCHAIKTSDS